MFPLTRHQRRCPRADRTDVFPFCTEAVNQVKHRLVGGKRFGAGGTARQEQDVVSGVGSGGGRDAGVVRDDADVAREAGGVRLVGRGSGRKTYCA